MQFLRKSNSIVAVILSACFLMGCQIENTESNVAVIMKQERPFSITRFDEETQWQEGKEIDLSTQSGQMVISDGGVYRITGQASEGLVVEAEDQNVHLFLNNITIKTKAGPAIWVHSAGKVVITLEDGSNNVISDYPSLVESENADAALFCVSDLTINGKGSLEVSGYYKDAIYSKDVLKILGGNIIVRSKNDGVRGSDGVVLAPVSLSVESEKSGICTANIGKSGKGCIDIWSGNIDIVAGEYGIQAASKLYVNEANVTCQGVIADVRVDGQEYIANECMD